MISLGTQIVIWIITNYFGIDIRKDVFDVVDFCVVRYRLNKCEKGFDDFLDILDQSSQFIMQSTAFYYIHLANALYQDDIKVSVENQLAVMLYSDASLKD